MDKREATDDTTQFWRTAAILTAALLAVLSVGAVTAGPGTDATTVTGCDTIDSAGSYEFTTDVTNSTLDSCINVTASNVIFDGQGHRIDGDGTGSGELGINVTGSSTLSNVTVREVTLTDWDEGVSYDDVSDGLVAGITATDNGGSGVGIGAGIEIEDSTGVDVRASNLSGNQFALALIGSSNGNVTDTIANNNDEDAFFGGDSYTFRNNTANANANSGFEIDNDNRLYNNTVIDNGRIGLNVGNDNLLVNTTAIDNEGEEFFGDVNNTARNFDVGASTAPNTTLSFAATNVVIEGVSSPPPDPGTERNIGRYVRAEKRAGSTTSYFDVTFQYEDSDVANVDEANLSVWKYNDSWTELGTDSRDAGANEIQYNFSTVPDLDRPILAPLATTTGDLNNIANCRQITPATVPADGLVNLTADITDSPASTCIQISADDVTFDGQGHTIDGDDSGLDSGILVSDGATLSNVTVRNVTVTDWAAGVEYEDVDGGLVTEVTATDNDGDGINVGSSIGVDVAAVNASGNDGDGVSFFSGSSSGGSVTDTVVANNGANGFQGGDSYTFRNTTVVGNGNGGFAAGDNNTIVGTTITDTGGDGISAGNDNRIVNNTVRNNTGSGFFIDDDNTLINNTARNNTGNGFVAINDNTLVNNTAIDNGGSDVWVFANNTVENLDLGASTAPDTTIDFTATDVRLGSVRSPPSDPDGEQNIGRFINATNTSQDAFLDVTFEYEDSDVTDLNESTLSVWQYEGSWSELGADDHDTGANEIRFNVTSFSTFGVFGESDVCLSYLRSIADDGEITTRALLTAIDHWRDDQIDTPCLLDAIDYWRNDTPV
jgi:parallel beta-helix repeat protein